MSYRDDLTTIGAQVDGEIAALKAENASADAAISALTAERDALKSDVAELQARLDELQSPPPPPVVIHPTYRVADGTASALDAVLRKAEPGDTVHFPAGVYAHATLRWPDGVHLTGDGCGASRLDYRLKFGSGSHIGGVVMGKSGSFAFASGSHGSRFDSCRFRSASAFLWDLCDFTRYWSDPVRCAQGNVHDVIWKDCEFESTDDTTFNIWWDSRDGGGSVYDLTWDGCSFGVRNAAGRRGPGRVGILIQPSPPEHATDGPRPNGISNTNFAFDFSRVTHGSGMAAGGEYGFRVRDCNFLGVPTLASFDLCDYIRAWAMVTNRLTAPSAVTQMMRDAAPDRVTTKGVEVTGCWMGGKFIQEYGRGVVSSGNAVRQGTAYHVPASVLTHDAELYG